VFQAVRRRHRLVERHADGGLLRDGVAEVRVGVDERRHDDVRRVRRRPLDGLDPTVPDDDAATDRVERLADEHRPGDLLHTGPSAVGPIWLCVRPGRKRRAGAERFRP